MDSILNTNATKLEKNIRKEISTVRMLSNLHRYTTFMLRVCVYISGCVYMHTYKSQCVKITSPIPAIIHGQVTLFGSVSTDKIACTSPLDLHISSKHITLKHSDYVGRPPSMFSISTLWKRAGCRC